LESGDHLVSKSKIELRDASPSLGQIGFYRKYLGQSVRRHVQHGTNGQRLKVHHDFTIALTPDLTHAREQPRPLRSHLCEQTE
jgi:hypothetical protein